MEEKILTLAAKITGGDEADALLQALCAGAGEDWRGCPPPKVSEEEVR